MRGKQPKVDENVAFFLTRLHVFPKAFDTHKKENKRRVVYLQHHGSFLREYRSDMEFHYKFVCVLLVLPMCGHILHSGNKS